MQNFIDTIQKAYTTKGDSIFLGAALYNGAVIKEAAIRLPLKTMNRHGLIAGATGTGKTKTLQMLTEALSQASVPCLVMDIKGDLSGIAAAGEWNDKIKERTEAIGFQFEAKAYPVEFYTLAKQNGVQLKATVSEFGPILLSKILDLNETQAGLVSMIFKFCDDRRLPLLDLKDFIKVLQYVSNEGKAEMSKDYGNISTTSTGTILRKVIELQQQGADSFFGEPSFDVEDLMRINEQGMGMVNVLRLNDLQDRPKLFASFMLCLLAELYSKLPEEGDLDRPKLCLFIDEAHLIFNEASKALLDQIETIIKLIRSKGVGIYFITQSPADIPAAVLGQLGLKVQHALRAFTAADRKSIKLAAENFPISEFYQTDEIITQLGMGEALVTGLNEKGIPTPLAAVMLNPPCSRMNVLSENELDAICSQSKLIPKYNRIIDERSAYEILSEKLNKAIEEEESETEETESNTNRKNSPREKSTLEEILSSPVTKQVARTATQVLTRTLLGALGVSSSGRKKKSSWF
ncbi:MAG: helicase HerA-like domain-containing protein [Bacteroidia bacterium]